jgi:hypothetical protein
MPLSIAEVLLGWLPPEEDDRRARCMTQEHGQEVFPEKGYTSRENVRRVARFHRSQEVEPSML